MNQSLDKFAVWIHNNDRTLIANTMPDLPEKALPFPYPENLAEYTKLSEQYYQEVLAAPESKRLEFFAGIQKQVERAIKSRFDKAGYKLVRVQPAPGIFYKVISKKDIFGFNVIDRHLILTTMILDACYVPGPQGALPPEFPPLPKGAQVAVADVKMLLPEYRKKKIKIIADVAFEKFIPMKKLI